ncbi:S-layer homology domain-containing protein [Paenibacillus sp. FSL H8-0537]|uniref:S-layer homology domain-containing protein n=1 Tax=Paenibacillus sp. FSL H8-0537 TaxID=2921399 RepID=UPI0031018985
MKKQAKNIIAGVVSISILLQGGMASAKEANGPNQDIVKDRQVYASTSAASFKDIKGHWAEATIKQAIVDGYLKGYSDGTFKPNGLITRAELASVLVRITKNKKDGSKLSFTDVPSGYWAASAIEGAVGAGFIKAGDAPGGKFKPNEAMTRYDMAKWFSQGLVRSEASFETALKEVEGTLLPFTETYKTGISKTQTPYIALARGTGLMKGNPDDSFGLENTTTRAEVAVMLYRYLRIEGSKAGSYRGLNELREVGLYGTNAVSLGNATWSKDSKDVVAPVYNIMGKKFIMKGKRGSFILHQMIVVDISKPLGTEERGIYGSMFDQRMGATFLIYTETTVTAEKKMKHSYEYLDSYDFLGGSVIFGDSPERFGYETVPRQYGASLEYKDFSDFLQVGKPRTIWTTIGTTYGMQWITAADGTVGTIMLNRK